MRTELLTIRTAKSDDAEALLAIYEPYVMNTAITFEYQVPSVKEFESRIINILKKYPYLVAERAGHIVGYAYAYTFKGRAAYDWSVETTVYVKQNCHQEGVGRSLYERLEHILRQQHITNMYACISTTSLEDDYLTNDSPLFHEKMGFKTVGTFHDCGYKFKRWYNMIWMEKVIGEHIENQMPVIPFDAL